MTYSPRKFALSSTILIAAALAGAASVVGVGKGVSTPENVIHAVPSTAARTEATLGCPGAILDPFTVSDANQRAVPTMDTSPSDAQSHNQSESPASSAAQSAMSGRAVEAPASGAPVDRPMSARATSPMSGAPMSGTPSAMSGADTRASGGDTAASGAQSGALMWASTQPTRTWSPATSTLSGVRHSEGAPPTGAVIAGYGGGELRSLTISGCKEAATEQYFAIGSTTLGEDLVLTLVNPSSLPTQVDITAFSSIGPISVPPLEITVPAGQSAVVLPASWIVEEQHPVLKIAADGPGVVAWMQTSGMQGELPLGTARVPSTTPATQHVIPGLVPGKNATARVFVPGPDPAHVTLSVSGEDAMVPLGGGEADIDPQAALDIPIGSVPKGVSALGVSSTVPVVVQVLHSGEGGAFASTTSTWGSRDGLSPSTPVTSARLPGSTDMTAAVTQTLSTASLRPTAQQTASGVSEVNSSLSLTAPADAPATVTIGGTTLDIPAGATRQTPLPATSENLSATVPIHVSVTLSATTPTGPLQASWPVGTPSAAVAAGTVLVND